MSMMTSMIMFRIILYVYHILYSTAISNDESHQKMDDAVSSLEPQCKSAEQLVSLSDKVTYCSITFF